MDFGDAGGNCVYFMALQSADPLEPRRGRGDGPNIAALIARAYDKAISLAPSPALAAAPDAVGVTGLDTYVWAEKGLGPITATAAAGGITVTAEAAVVEYRWDFGDGGHRVTDHPGRPFRLTGNGYVPGDIDHLYETRGTYTLAAEAVWSARYRINDGPWQALGYFSTTDDRDYPVRQVVPVLTRSRR
jgi:hypothetical protein